MTQIGWMPYDDEPLRENRLWRPTSSHAPPCNSWTLEWRCRSGASGADRVGSADACFRQFHHSRASVQTPSSGNACRIWPRTIHFATTKHRCEGCLPQCQLDACPLRCNPTSLGAIHMRRRTSPMFCRPACTGRSHFMASWVSLVRIRSRSPSMTRNKAKSRAPMSERWLLRRRFLPKGTRPVLALAPPRKPPPPPPPTTSLCASGVKCGSLSCRLAWTCGITTHRAHKMKCVPDLTHQRITSDNATIGVTQVASVSSVCRSPWEGWRHACFGLKREGVPAHIL